MAMAPEQAAIGIRRRFTTEGVHPYDLVEWERRDARITNYRDGSVAFEQLGVEFPVDWSLNATNIVAQKYFRGTIGTPEREWSLKQVADRVADTITDWGVRDGYFVDDREADAFRDELKYLIVTQRAAFNSPVWFNIGVKGVPQQGSACFILAVDDTMDSILNWYTEEGTIFKGGSGAGVNLSRIRSSRELLKGGGTASGPVSFMRGADASAGTIKSGGKTRRAAKMVILNVDHPDIEEFIWCKAHEEQKARALEAAGFDMSLDGKDITSVQYQNANNSVRVTDEFMQAVVDDADWNLRAVITGDVIKTVKARDLMRQIAQATWECADPGMQFDTTINHWHTATNTGRINGSNPCFPGDALVHTDKGLISFVDLIDRTRLGETFGVYTHDATNVDAPAERLEVTSPEAVMITGMNEIVKLRFSNGAELRCTPNHSIFTVNRGYVAAAELTSEDRVKTLDLPAPAIAADHRLPVSTDVRDYADRDARTWKGVQLPEKWSEEFAQYLGWLVGDGCISGDTATTVYGSEQDREHVLPRHRELLTELNGGREPKPSVQANGTEQLRQSRSAITRFLEALGVSDSKAPEKAVPWSINEAPPEIVAAFLRGLFDADGCVRDGSKERYVGLGSSSHELLRGAQRLLSTVGVFSRIYVTRKESTDVAFTYVRNDGTFSIYESSPMFDLRITGRSIERFADAIGFSIPHKVETLRHVLTAHRRYSTDTTVRLTERTDDGVELTYNLSEPRNHSYIVNGLVVRNCSEYMHLDNSACNLASINLLKFLDDDGTFDVESFEHAVEIFFTGQEIIVGNADYPTEAIGENSRRFRQLGLGYANLGALLMALGLPYDSDAGRAWAGAITALMTGHAYATSARTAARMGPFAGYTENEEHMLRVLDQHRAEAAKIDEELVPSELLSAAQRSWDAACEVAADFGVRNSQSSVLAPTGTIGLMMDCDTTGVEPDLGLVKLKKLVGGGTMSIVNQTVPRALRNLEYTEAEIDQIIAYIDEHKTILGAPNLKQEHLEVFACSMGDNVIHYLGHVKMMGAVQPFISGAISKTVNMPEDVSVEDVEQLHIDAWQLGLKAVAVYRDNCKVAQPLAMAKKDDASADAPAEATQVIERIVEKIVREPSRTKLPRTRTSRTFEFRVADCKGFVTVGEYDDGRPGEIFVRVSKQGSTLAGIMDAFAISVSHGLQYGVPLRSFVEAFTGMRFEPAGMTDDPEIRIANSLMDYLFRKLAVMYLSQEERAELNILTVEERKQPTLPGVEETVVETRQGSELPADPPSIESASTLFEHEPATTTTEVRHSDAPMCMQCGVQMIRAGSCHACPSCGTTSGCS
jgi:ribonucleoside-diphosphate reductase alpha chain